MIWVSVFALAWSALLTIAFVGVYVRLTRVEKQKNIEKVMNPYPFGVGGLSAVFLALFIGHAAAQLGPPGPGPVPGVPQTGGTYTGPITAPGINSTSNFQIGGVPVLALQGLRNAIIAGPPLSSSTTPV